MIVNYINYQTLLAAQESAQWAKWTCLVGLAGVIVTAIATIVAFRALGQWKLQYREDKKIKLIDSLIMLNNVLISIPKDLSDDKDLVNRKSITAAVSEVHARCRIYLSDRPNEALLANLNLLNEKFAAFISGKAYKSEIALCASKMLMIDLS